MPRNDDLIDGQVGCDQQPFEKAKVLFSNVPNDQQLGRSRRSGRLKTLHECRQTLLGSQFTTKRQHHFMGLNPQTIPQSINGVLVTFITKQFSIDRVVQNGSFPFD